MWSDGVERLLSVKCWGEQKTPGCCSVDRDFLHVNRGLELKISVPDHYSIRFLLNILLSQSPSQTW